MMMVSVTAWTRFLSYQAEVRANLFAPPFVNDLRVIVSPGGIGFINLMMVCRKTNVCKKWWIVDLSGIE
jgi:hypothetical protein